MARDTFPVGVDRHLKWYVYRLIDPRNGETFYVGKGQGNRIFQHAKGALEPTEEEDETDFKTQRIKEIAAAGLEVGHLVHRHGIDSENAAYEVEAALIDAYPGLTNQAAGHGSGDYGCRHVEEIIRQYGAEPFEVDEPLVLISMGKSLDEGQSIYDGVRWAWRVSPLSVGHKLVLAHNRGMVVGAYRPDEWLEATSDNFPGWRDVPGRYGFHGKKAESEVWNKYVGKRVPDEYRQAAGQNPIRYCDPPQSRPSGPTR